jgi:hypothetical protein
VSPVDLTVAIYPVMAVPPSYEGMAHVAVIPPFTGVTEMFLGALAIVAGTPLYEAEAVPVPAVLVAVTVNA